MLLKLTAASGDRWNRPQRSMDDAAKHTVIPEILPLRLERVRQATGAISLGWIVVSVGFTSSVTQMGFGSSARHKSTLTPEALDPEPHGVPHRHYRP